GDYPIIAFAPDSPQEMFDLTFAAFNAAEEYRSPVLVLADQTVGHMTGRVEIPESVETTDRPRPSGDPDPEEFLPFDGSTDVPPMAEAGDGYRVHVTGLTHDERGYPDIDVGTQKEMMDRLMGKIEDNREDIVETEDYQLDDADVGIIAYGSTSRSARQAVRDLREEGIDAGLLRVVTPWPLPIGEFDALAEQVEDIVVAEMNLGQYVHPVREHVDVPVTAHTHAGGEIPQPAEIVDTVREVVR
ncbi:MAG: transketolase C-terminal domain-containing protein, partial [Halodesulfurarchaeum sp.]